MADIASGGGFDPAGQRGAPRPLNTALAAAVALTVGGGILWWGAGLGARDISRIPVVEALHGPIKRRPLDDGQPQLSADQNAVDSMIEGEGARTAYADPVERPTEEDRAFGSLARTAAAGRTDPRVSAAPSGPATLAAPGMAASDAAPGPRAPSISAPGRTSPDLSALGLPAPGASRVAPAASPVPAVDPRAQTAGQSAARSPADAQAAAREDAARLRAQAEAQARAAAARAAAEAAAKGEAESAAAAARLEAERLEAQAAAARAAAEALAPPPPAEPEDALAEAPRFAPVASARPDAAERAVALAVARQEEAQQASRVATLALNAGDDAVQLGAFESERVAEAQWGRLAGRHDDLLSGFAHAVTTVESGGRTLFRLRAGPLGGREAARNLCAAFKTRGVPCIPVRIK